MQKDPDSRLLEQLSRSRIYQDYEQAFGDATKLPLSLRPLKVWEMAHRKKRYENPFCAMLAESREACAACLQVQKEITQGNGETKTVTCFAGLCDTAVPVTLGSKIIGYLQTGQVALTPPSKPQFQRITRQLIEWGSKVNLNQLEEAYYQSRVLDRKQYEAMIRLLEIFAMHLSTVSNQIATQEQLSEPPIIRKAKDYIEQHKSDDITLTQVAEALNVSTFYFCKLFKKATGLTFSEYLARVRVEKAKNLLLNPNLRISEIAYEVGFQSLTHFNRVFRRLAGRSPTEYRKSLPK